MIGQRNLTGASLALILATSGLLAGCGSAPDSAGSTPARTTATPAPATATPTEFAAPCPAGGKQLRLHGPAGTEIEAVAIRPGRRDAVVLLHEAGSGYCNAWSFATWLVTHEHVQVVMVNRCGYGETTCTKRLGDGDAQIAATTQPAIDYARAHGARNVTLIGASSGASDAVQVAAAVHGVRAVVALSPDRTDTGDLDAHFDRDRLPTLMAYAPEDSYCPPKAEHRWFGQIPAATKRLVVAPEPHRHGWELVLDDSGHPLPLAATVTSWLHDHDTR